MTFELQGKTIQTASTRIEDGVQLNFDLRFLPEEFLMLPTFLAHIVFASIK